MSAESNRGPGDPAVRARGLVKQYGHFQAVRGIDLLVRRGECFGVLGPNGAGKSTTMKMIYGRTPPSAGELFVLGMDVRTEMRRIKARIGVVPQEDNLDPDFTVIRNLLVFARYFGLSRRIARERAEQLLDFVGLAERRDSRVDSLSGGMKRRLVIARALINDPELLILDEPTTGLDPQARQLVWSKMRELRTRGVTLLLTTHYMEEAARLCDRLVIMDGGRILAEGSPQGLIEAHAGPWTAEVMLPPAQHQEALRRLEVDTAAGVVQIGNRGIRGWESAEDRLLLYTESVEEATAACERLKAMGLGGAGFFSRPTTLDDLFLRLTGRTLREG
ncbi:MAG: ABC transporter ATP-binding protein [Kyrpidia tusciae]|nr:ABC transporter ATP-binding protein [Kyrpidia tusciae]MBE3553316.1 ABC transporter ATP-binding protein [Kyrpidia tusciae]